MIKKISIKKGITSPIHSEQIRPNEVLELSEKYGPTDCYYASLNLGDEHFSHWESLCEKKRNRRGEVVMIIRNQQNRILLHTKDFYPNNVYRIPTGGINTDESLEQGLNREVFEETGFKIKFIHFLALLLYEFKNKTQVIPFISYLFDVIPDGAHPVVKDENEKISGFEWLPQSKMSLIVKQLKNLHLKKWRDWGIMRSIPHEILLNDYHTRN